MKFVCPKCKTAYQVPDDRLRSGVVKAVCKKCGATLRFAGLPDKKPPAAPDSGATPQQRKHPRPQVPPVIDMSTQQPPPKDPLAIVVVVVALLILVLATVWVIRDVQRFISGPAKTLTRMIEELTAFKKSSNAKSAGSGSVSGGRLQKILNKGHRHFYARRYDQALAQYQAAVAFAPQNAEAYFWRGRAELKTGRHDRAIEDFEQALSLKPNHQRACDNLAWLYMQKKNYPKSLEFLDKSLQLKPENGWAYFTRSHVYRRLAEPQKALSDARQACALGLKKACDYYEKHKDGS